jgi:predicted DNA-binding transcriptional regulator YafY
MPAQDAFNRAIRLIQLERLLLDDPQRKWRTSEVARKLNVSVDTAFDDLQGLSLSGLVPLVSEGSTANFTWQVSPDARVSLPPLRLDYAQGAALYAAARLLSQQQDERNDTVRSALGALISVLPTPLRPQLEAVVTDLARPPVAGNVTDIFQTLSQAWLSRRVVTVDYDPPRRRRYTCRFAPYLLEPSGIGHTLYFIGHSDPPSELRTYKLERIRHAALTEETFIIPDDFDGIALLRRAWGVMYGDGDLETVKLRFSQFVSKRVRETRWHPSEKLTDTAEGLVWEAQIGDITEIRPWIRGWGADCEVLEPAGLRDEMIAEARRLARRYGIGQASGASDGPDQGLLDALFGKE